MEAEPFATETTPPCPLPWRRIVVVGLFLLALIHPLAQWGARLYWPLDLLTHFQEPALAVTILGLIVSLAFRHRLIAALLLCLGVYQVVPLTTVWMPNPVPPSLATAKPIRILMANVYDVNERYDLLAELIRREDPDIVGLVEVTTGWAEALERSGVVKGYPYRRSMPFGARGFAIWFKKPPIEFRPFEVLTTFGNPISCTRFQLGDRVCTLFLVHPPNPLHDQELANEELLALGHRIGQESGTRIAIGDFNRTDGSPFFHDFMRLSGLRDSRIGFGRQASWPSWSPYRIAIDHAFVSDDLSVVSRRIGPDIGSDHRPLLLELAPARIDARSTESR